jgi:hypothetical protein
LIVPSSPPPHEDINKVVDILKEKLCSHFEKYPQAAFPVRSFKHEIKALVADTGMKRKDARNAVIQGLDLDPRWKHIDGKFYSESAQLSDSAAEDHTSCQPLLSDNSVEWEKDVCKVTEVWRQRLVRHFDRTNGTPYSVQKVIMATKRSRDWVTPSGLSANQMAGRVVSMLRSDERWELLSDQFFHSRQGRAG